MRNNFLFLFWRSQGIDLSSNLSIFFVVVKILKISYKLKTKKSKM